MRHKPAATAEAHAWQPSPRSRLRRPGEALHKLADPCHGILDARDFEAKFCGKTRKRLGPMRRRVVQRRGPGMSRASAKHHLAGLSDGGRVVGDECLEEQQVDEVAEAVIALAGARRERQPMEFLGDVKPQRQARERVRAGDAERVAQRNRREPLNLGLAGFGARAVLTSTLVHAWPRYVTANSTLTVPLSSNRGPSFRLNANP